jgi:hypothetical protein
MAILESHHCGGILVFQRMTSLWEPEYSMRMVLLRNTEVIQVHYVVYGCRIGKTFTKSC